jgi:hypothetical protein
VLSELGKHSEKPLEFFSVFKNPKGTRFTRLGYELAQKIWTIYVVRIQKGTVVKNKALVMLDQRMTWPYYLSNTKLVLFNEMDAFEFSLYQGDINLWANKS